MQHQTTKMPTSRCKSSIINNYYCRIPIQKKGEIRQINWTQLVDEVTKVEEYVQEQVHKKRQAIVEQNIQPRMSHLKKLENKINGLTDDLEKAILSFKEIALEVNKIYHQITKDQMSQNVSSSQLSLPNLVSINMLRLPLVVANQSGYILKDKIFMILSEENC